MLVQLVDIFDASANKWSTAKLSANRSNLDAANVAGKPSQLSILKRLKEDL